MNILKFVKNKSSISNRRIILIFLLNLLASGLGIIVTYLVGTFIDMLTYNPNMRNVYIGTAILFTVEILSITLNIVFKYKLTDVSSDMVFYINRELLMHVKKLPFKFFSNNDSVYLNQRINSDCNKVVNFFSTVLIQTSVQIVSFIVILLIMVNYDYKLTILALLSIPIYIYIYIYFKKELYSSSLAYQEEQSIFFSNLNKQLSNLKYIKLNSLYEKLDNSLTNYYPQFKSKLLMYTKNSSVFSFTSSIFEKIFNVFLYFYGGIQILKNNMTIGDFIIIKTYYLILLQMSSMFLNLIKTYPEILVSYNRLLDLLKLETEYNGNLMLDKFETISIDNLTFDIDDKNIIENFSYTFKSGNIYLIKGNNGAGKSTLLNLILGLYSNEYKGDITFNKFDVKDLDIYTMRKQSISVVEQEPAFIDFIIKDEICDYSSDTKMFHSLLKDFSVKIDNTLDNLENLNFSGGEKQKISLARALSKKSNLIVLDEPTSALDKESVSYLNKILLKKKSTSMIFIVSHDKRLDEVADFTISL